MIAFHRLLIATAIAFCAGFAVWGWREYESTRLGWALASAVVFAVFACGLAIYLANLKRFLGT